MVDFEFEGEFQSISLYESGSIALNDGNVLRATFKLNTNALSDPTVFLFYLSNDGGTTWNQVTLNREYTFLNTGQDLRYRIVAPEGESINLAPGNGYRYQILIPYATG